MGPRAVLDNRPATSEPAHHGNPMQVTPAEATTHAGGSPAPRFFAWISEESSLVRHSCRPTASGFGHPAHPQRVFSPESLLLRGIAPAPEANHPLHRAPSLESDAYSPCRSEAAHRTYQFLECAPVLRVHSTNRGARRPAAPT